MRLNEILYPNRPESLFPKAGWNHDEYDQQAPDFDRTGADYGILYHAGPVPIIKVDPSKLQQMDHGFYGKGFYVTAKREAALGGGVSQGVISEFRLQPTARVLIVRKDNGLVHALRRFLYESEIDQAEDQSAELNLIGRCTLMPWRDNIFYQTADRYAITDGYDAVDYRSSEIVIKSFDMLMPVGIRGDLSVRTESGR